MDHLDVNLSIKWKLYDEIPEVFHKTKFTLRRLKSKKNLVFDISFIEGPNDFPSNIILKLFNTPNFQRELEILQILKKQNLNVPSILFYKNPYLVLEKIQGSNICDFINDNLMQVKTINELNGNTRHNLLWSINNLAKWFAKLHSNNVISQTIEQESLVLNKSDARLRDFIIDKDKNVIYGLDFEEAYEGNHLDDLAWVCCSLLDTNPGIFELEEPYHKIELINQFIKQYYKINTDFKFSFSYFANTIIEDLNIVIKRRDLSIGNLNKSRILNNLKKEF
ncbi:MAG: hypothetical protein EU543_04675 [Promethearchaeota archaeon]|nr:MAG: hypothetical protein EU543_04675 [Candidatus Lokiarchaeota archaeon]